MLDGVNRLLALLPAGSLLQHCFKHPNKMKITREIYFSPISKHFDLRMEMTDRTTGHTRKHNPTLRELLDKASEVGGEYDDKPVNSEMLVKDLLDWHSDFTFEIAE